MSLSDTSDHSYTLVAERQVTRMVESDSRVLWSGIRKIADAIPTLHWVQYDPPQEWILQFRVDVFFPHLVYPSVGRVALFLEDLIRC